MIDRLPLLEEPFAQTLSGKNATMVIPIMRSRKAFPLGKDFSFHLIFKFTSVSPWQGVSSKLLLSDLGTVGTKIGSPSPFFRGALAQFAPTMQLPRRLSGAKERWWQSLCIMIMGLKPFLQEIVISSWKSLLTTERSQI